MPPHKTGNRIEDNPFFIHLADTVKEIHDDQKEIQRAIFDPEKGIHQRLQHIEIWKKNINDERATYKKWLAKIIWTILAALLLGGGIAGWVIDYKPPPGHNSQAENNGR